MLKIINDLPDSTLGIFAEGKVSGKDYKIVFIRSLKEKLKTNDKIRFLYRIGNNLESFEVAAMIDDSQVGFKHLSNWKKIAPASDHQIITVFTKLFDYLLLLNVPCIKIAI